MWKFCGKAHFSQNFHTRKSGEITVLSAVIPHEILVCSGKDPPWFNRKITLSFDEKLSTYKAYPKIQVIFNYSES